MSSHTIYTGKAQIVELTNLINAAVRDVLSEYDAVGETIPLLESTASGPFDSPEAVTPRLAKAVRTIEAACAQLSFAVASPGHVIANKAYGAEEPVCMLVVTDAKIADILLNKPEGVHITEIAEKAGLPSGKLGRILRVLATKHCFKEVKPDVFANNRLSLQLLSTNPVSGLVGHLTDEGLHAAAYLNETLISKGLSSSPKDSPFYHAHGYTLFDYFASPKGKLRGDRFAQAMVGWGNVTGKSMLPRVYAWDKLPAGSAICDVGGGTGHVTLDVVKAFPSLKVVVQDLPEVVAQGKEYWAEKYPEAIESQLVQFVPMDFFKDSAVSGCGIYYIRHILHDWPDSECVRILNNVRKAMDNESRLLIHEFVLQHAVRNPSTKLALDEAPEPLLANYGMGRIRLYQQDIFMMQVLNSKERTLQEFIDIASQAGFKFEYLWDAGESGLIEFSIAD